MILAGHQGRKHENQELVNDSLKRYLQDSSRYRELALKGLKLIKELHENEKKGHYFSAYDQLKLFQDIYSQYADILT